MKNKEIIFLTCVITFIILYFAFVTNVIDKRLESVDTTEATEEVTIVNNNAGASVVMSAPELTNLGEFKLTAYCSCSECCGEWAENRPVDDYGNELVLGSTGTILVNGYSIAVDPNVIPYGSIVVINGKEYKAQDCGGGINGNEIDIYFSDHETADEFGVQYADVYFFE